MFPSIDPSGPVAQLLGMVQGVQQQDQANLASAQNQVLAALMQQMMATTQSPSAGFAEGASGSAPLAQPDTPPPAAAPPGPPPPTGPLP